MPNFRVAIALMAALATFNCNASCSVSEMVTMRKNGAGQSAIKQACDEEVDDAPICNFNKVLQLVIQKKLRHEVEDRCTACDQPKCSTLYGECAMVGTYSVDKSGDDCTCAYPAGYANGSITCEN